jgi:hypothetical protein
MLIQPLHLKHNILKLNFDGFLPIKWGFYPIYYIGALPFIIFSNYKPENAKLEVKVGNLKP